MASDPICPGDELRERLASLEADLKSLFDQAPSKSPLGALYSQVQQTQAELLKQERMQALAQMASGIAHDLNNSLTPIIGFSDYLLEAEPNFSNETKRCLRGIRTAAADIVQVIEHLRQFYRSRDAFGVSHLVDLNSLVLQTLENPASRVRPADSAGHGVKIQTDLGKNLPTIRHNQSELRQAIENLVLNALEAMPKGGTLRVATRLCDRLRATGAEKAAPRVVLEVQDTGTGMDEATQQRCGEPFFSTKGPRGRGVGLALVYGVVRRNQGTIEIQSQPGCGTTVRLFLNASQASADEQALQSSCDSPLQEMLA
jgi:signal transduction histidine kinase